MFSFLNTIFSKITSAVATAIIAVGLVSVPSTQLESLPQIDIVETKKEPKTVAIEQIPQPTAKNEITQIYAPTKTEEHKPVAQPKPTQIPKSSPQQPLETPKNTATITTLPNGAVVEINENGNIIRYIREAPSTALTTTQTESLEITSFNAIPSEHSAKIEWYTNIPTDSKVFFTEPNGSLRIITSKSGNSTHHLAEISNLILNTKYTYEIEAIARLHAKKIAGDFRTLPQTFFVKAISSPTDPNDIMPFLQFSSNGTVTIKRLVFTHDDSYCIGGYLGYTVNGLNLQYATGGSDAKKDLTGRFIIDFPEPGLSAILFRLSASQDGRQSNSCVNPGVKFILSGSESLIYDETGQRINFQNAVLTSVGPALVKKLDVNANKNTVVISDWDSVTIGANYTENGETKPVTYSFSAPDKSQISSNSTFIYKPKTSGVHTINVTANGTAKSVNMYAIEKVDPKIEKRTIYQQDANNSDYPVTIPEYPMGYDGATIAAFSLSEADEPLRINEIIFESGINENNFLLFANGNSFSIFGNGAPVDEKGMFYQVKVRNTTNLPVGIHTFTFKEIKMVGQKSGLYRYVSGLPFYFTFKIK